MTPRERVIRELRVVLDEVEGHRKGYQHSGARDVVAALQGIERMIETRIKVILATPDEVQ